MQVLLNYCHTPFTWNRYIFVFLHFQIGQPATPQPEIPIIQVRNDQYQPPQPHTMYPPREPQYPREAPYPRVEPSESVLYSESPAQPVLQRTVPNTSNSAFTKSVANDTAQISVQQSSVKRKVPVGGPLKLSNTNTVPVIEAPVGRSSESTTKYSRVTVDEPPMKKTKEEVSDDLRPSDGENSVVVVDGGGDGGGGVEEGWMVLTGFQVALKFLKNPPF